MKHIIRYMIAKMLNMAGFNVSGFCNVEQLPPDELTEEMFVPLGSFRKRSIDMALDTCIQGNVESGGENWRKSSLANKYNNLLLELDALKSAQRTNSNTQILIQMKEREITLVTDIYYIETTMLRMELSNIRSGKI